MSGNSTTITSSGLALARDLHRRVQGEPGRAADQDALLARQAARRDERLLVGDLDDLVDQLDVHRPGHEVLADALDLVWRDRARVERALRVGADDVDRRLALLEVLGDAADRPAGAHARDEHVDRALGLLPDLRAGRPVVGLGVARVEVLVGLKRAGDLARQPVGDRVVGLRRLALDVGRADHDVGAVRLAAG